MPARDFVESVNPSTGETIARYRLESTEQCVKKAKSAARAFENWRSLSTGERNDHVKKLARVLRNRRNEFAKLMTAEMGKTITQSEAEVEKCAWTAEVYAENTERWLADEVVDTDAKESFVTFEPLGVVFSIMPWNFPFWQAFRFAVPALAAGNVSLMKHSNVCPGCSVAIRHTFEDAGFPEGVFDSVISSHEAVPALIASSHVQGVSFTGSVEAGSRVGELAGKHIKKVVLELGGSDPFVVLEDAPLKKAARAATEARLVCAGQSCIAAKRFIVEKSVAGEFTDLFVEEFQAKRVGDPADRSTDVGPLSTAHQVQIVHRQVKSSLAQGAHAILGGKPRPGVGAFFELTVLDRVTKGMTVVKQEVFGPVAPILVVPGEREALGVANESEFGLGASIWTEDIAKGKRLARTIAGGMAFVNAIVKSDPRMPFGGIRKSGVGRELSKYGLKEFVNVKSVNIY
jgi:succinate-semialdehyde dehydrogenase/glutarate-semialdehyde dehydrogenase